MSEQLNLIKNKTYKELSDEGIRLVNNILEKFNITLKQRNTIFIAFLFDETIEQAFKKV